MLLAENVQAETVNLPSLDKRSIKKAIEDFVTDHLHKPSMIYTSFQIIKMIGHQCDGVKMSMVSGLQSNQIVLIP